MRERRERQDITASMVGTPNEWLTPLQVAHELHVSVKTIHTWFRKVAGVVDLGTQADTRRHTPGKQLIRIPRHVLDRFIKERLRRG
jgi:hypothetical protein